MLRYNLCVWLILKDSDECDPIPRPETVNSDQPDLEISLMQSYAKAANSSLLPPASLIRQLNQGPIVTIGMIVPSLDVWRTRFAGQLTTAQAARLINLFDRYSLEKTVIVP